MDRKTNVFGIDPGKMGGVDARDNATLKPGAKDSIPATANELTPFSGDVSIKKMGGFGGESITQKK
jgi:hypothetical protein